MMLDRIVEAATEKVTGIDRAAKRAMNAFCQDNLKEHYNRLRCEEDRVVPMPMLMAMETACNIL